MVASFTPATTIIQTRRSAPAPATTERRSRCLSHTSKCTLLPAHSFAWFVLQISRPFINPSSVSHTLPRIHWRCTSSIIGRRRRTRPAGGRWRYTSIRRPAPARAIAEVGTSWRVTRTTPPARRATLQSTSLFKHALLAAGHSTCRRCGTGAFAGGSPSLSISRAQSALSPFV